MSPADGRAALLLGKAREDATAVERFASEPALADGVIGFHAQQAVEKAMRAVLTAKGPVPAHTHDLRYLLEELERAGIDAPDGLREADELTPWAVEQRYGDTVDERLDREQAISLVGAALSWADQMLGS